VKLRLRLLGGTATASACPHQREDDNAASPDRARGKQGQAVMRLERAAVLAAAAALFASCGGDGAESASALPDCAGAGDTIDRPESLPDEFPVPDGTAFVGERTSGRFTLVDARSPGELQAVREFFERELADAGFELGEGEAEEHEAETDFAGNGASGHLVVRRIGGCDGVVSLGVATAPDQG
jgi:hypothetical protein